MACAVAVAVSSAGYRKWYGKEVNYDTDEVLPGELSC